MLGDESTGGYQRFLSPGLLGMVMLFAAMLVSLSVVYDKEFGIMRLLIISPLPHYWVVIAKTVSGMVVAVVQAGAFAVLLALLGYIGGGLSLPLLVLGLFATALACASLGMLIAVWSSTLDNFAVVMNFVIFPVFFLSGALYPVQQLPDVLKIVAAVNPFTYGVDLLKHALVSELAPPLGADFFDNRGHHGYPGILGRCRLRGLPAFLPRVRCRPVGLPARLALICNVVLPVRSATMRQPQAVIGSRLDDQWETPKRR